MTENTQIEDAEEEKPQEIKDLETIDAALGDLEENGVDADSQALEDAFGVLGNLIETAEDSDHEESEAHEMMIEGQDAIEAILEDEATEEDVDTAGNTLAAVGQQMQLVLLETVLGGMTE